MNQQEHDLRSRDLHIYLANKIKNNPDHYVPLIRTRLNYWKNIKSESSLPYILGWEKLLDSGLDTFLQFAMEDSEEANAYRQASPLGEAYDTPEERLEVIQNWNKKYREQN
jgi:hypothetical protein